jgi:hypothetical protein
VVEQHLVVVHHYAGVFARDQSHVQDWLGASHAHRKGRGGCTKGQDDLGACANTHIQTSSSMSKFAARSRWRAAIDTFMRRMMHGSPDCGLDPGQSSPRRVSIAELSVSATQAMMRVVHQSRSRGVSGAPVTFSAGWRERDVFGRSQSNHSTWLFVW